MPAPVPAAPALISTPAVPEIFASPIHGGCYIAGPSDCRIHVEPFTINIASGTKLASFKLVAIQMGTGAQTVIYYWRPDHINRPAVWHYVHTPGTKLPRPRKP